MRTAVEDATTGDVDWTFASDPESLLMLERAARKVAESFDHDQDDLYQDALLYAATRPRLQWLQLVRYLKDQVRKRRREVGDVTFGPEDAGTLEGMTDEHSGMVLDPWEGTAYPRLLVEQLLEAMWNGWVVVDEFRPDGDMPRAKPNPKTSGTAIAHKIDIERAWHMADLTEPQRATLYLVFGQGMTRQAVAELALHTYRQAVDRLCDAGLAALQTELNGPGE